ncbi:MAG: diacylglycerol kinase family protein [Bacteroidota bacterium]
MRKIFVVWNPASGGKSRKTVSELSELLQSRNLKFQIFDTHLHKNATGTVREQMDSSYTDLIIVGGDGTINEAINGLSHQIPISIVPTGTGNDFVKMVELGATKQEILTTAVDGELSLIDIGLCNDRRFINGIGIGFDGQIVEEMITKRVPLLRGHAAYYYHVLRILAGFKERTFSYKIGDKQYSQKLILLTIGNGSTFGGGFKLMPEAKINDGQLEVCEIGPISGLRRFLNISKLSDGTHGSLTAVKFHQTKSIKIGQNPLLFGHIDGERLGNPPFEITVESKAIQLRTKLPLSS